MKDFVPAAKTFIFWKGSSGSKFCRCNRPTRRQCERTTIANLEPLGQALVHWVQVSVVVGAESSEAVSQVFTALGATSVSLADAADQAIYEPAPFSHPLWTRTRISALFEKPVDLKSIATAVKSELPNIELLDWTIEILPDRVWEQVWKDHFKPMQFGPKLWVCPSHAIPVDPGAIHLKLDPGLAFGTGAHPSTALCLEWLATHELRGLKVIDYGCGTGILAIAAVLLGARPAIAIDIDEQALFAASSNAMNNGVSSLVSCRFPEQAALESADVVIANIVANVLEELAPILSESVNPGGKLVLSGILATQVDQVLDAYPNFEFLAPASRDEWVRLEGTRTRLMS